MRTPPDKLIIVTIEGSIEQRNSGKGNPAAIVHVGRPLNNRQRVLLDSLLEDSSLVEVRKKDVNMADLAALTAHTGDEFAMFTKGGTRMVLRGNNGRIELSSELLDTLTQGGYRWSGHTHPGFTRNTLIASDADYEVLERFLQKRSVVYNSLGRLRRFGEDD